MSRDERSRKVFLSLGSNIEPEKNIPACVRILREKFTVPRASSFYETEPVGPAGKNKFWNAVLEIETEQDLPSLMETLKSIESRLQRKRDDSNKFAPRTIDIDTLPQPDYQNQAFIMIPLAEIAANEIDPETGKSFKEIAEKWKESFRYKRVENF